MIFCLSEQITGEEKLRLQHAVMRVASYDVSEKCTAMVVHCICTVLAFSDDRAFPRGEISESFVLYSESVYFSFSFSTHLLTI